MAHSQEVAQYRPDGLGMNSLPIALNKASMRKYEDLEIPCEYILACYVWIDGSGIHMRSKDRTFNFIPKTNKDLPIWYYDGSSTLQAAVDNSDTYTFPQVIYHDPFRRGSNILVLCDTYTYTYQPTNTSFRKNCVVLCEKGEVEEPWFGFNQEFMLTTTDGRPLGWPQGGFPAPPGPYYCAIGANRVVARELVEAFYRCCLYAGVQINGINPGSTPSQWNFQVGPSPGIRSADDLWMARYILSRLAEEYGIIANFEPQPVPNWPGNGTFTYFSSKDMREDDGILVIERAIDKLARRHGAHINEYDANNGADNARRLNGKNGMPHIRDFTAENQVPTLTYSTSDPNTAMRVKQPPRVYRRSSSTEWLTATNDEQPTPAEITTLTARYIEATTRTSPTRRSCGRRHSFDSSSRLTSTLLNGKNYNSS